MVIIVGGVSNGVVANHGSRTKGSAEVLDTLVTLLTLCRLSQVHTALLDANCALINMGLDHDAHNVFDAREELGDRIRGALVLGGCRTADWAGFSIAEGNLPSL